MRRGGGREGGAAAAAARGGGGGVVIEGVEGELGWWVGGREVGNEVSFLVRMRRFKSLPARGVAG